MDVWQLYLFYFFKIFLLTTRIHSRCIFRRFEQATKERIGENNIGNQMLKVGYHINSLFDYREVNYGGVWELHACVKLQAENCCR